MSNLSMTTLLGVAAILGPAILAILAQSEDRANATKQCVGEKCPITSPVTGKKPLKTQHSAMKSGDGQKTILDQKSKDVRALASVPPLQISCGDGRAIVAKRFNS